MDIEIATDDIGTDDINANEIGIAMDTKKSPLRTVKVHARGEDFRIVQLVGNLLVCSKEHGNCCCGWTEKDRLPVNLALYQEEWQQRKIRNQVHLTFTACLGPCAVGNNALLQIFGRSIWLKDLNNDALIPRMFDYIEAILQAGQVVAPPADLAKHIYERYLPPPTMASDSAVADFPRVTRERASPKKQKRRRSRRVATCEFASARMPSAP